MSGTVLGLWGMGVSGIASGLFEMFPSGHVTGRVDAPRVTIAAFGGGDISVLGFPGTGGGRIKLSCGRDRDSWPSLMACKGRMKFCGGAKGIGHACAGSPFTAKIPMFGGDWTLALDLATDASNQVTGTAHATLTVDLQADFAVTGKYDPRSDTSSLELVGLAPAEKAKIALTHLAADGSAGVLRFKIAGQSGRFDLSTAP
jgi:hypothetical protein